MAIADVQEHQRSEIADAMHPAKQHDLLGDVRRTKGAARVRARQRT
jgi:hypothetical protein